MARSRFLLLLCSLFVLLLSACDEGKDRYTIDCQLTGLITPEVIFIKSNQHELTADTIYCEGEEFTYTASSDSLQMIRIYIQGGSTWFSVWAKNGDKIQITGDANQPVLISVAGGEVNNLLTGFKTANQQLIKELVATRPKTDELSLQQQQILKDLLKAKADSFLVAHPYSIASLVVIQDYLIDHKKPAELKGYLDKLPELQDQVIYKNLDALYMKLDQTTEGKKAPDFSIINLKGDTLALDTFNGKFLLMTFATSWCDRYESTIEEWQELHKETSRKELEMLTISLDEDSAMWKTLADEKKIKWQQVIDREGLGSDMVSRYNVTTLPQNYLLDKEGVIVARNVPADSIASIIKK